MTLKKNQARLLFQAKTQRPVTSQLGGNCPGKALGASVTKSVEYPLYSGFEPSDKPRRVISLEIDLYLFLYI